MSSQVPCYNPCGRYAVKLFAAGRWRKVEVDDCIPLDAARCPVSLSQYPFLWLPALIAGVFLALVRTL